MAQFGCERCGEGFEQRARHDRHLSAAELEKALVGVSFPKSKADLVAHATRRTPMESVIVRALERLPNRLYRDATEVGVAFGEAKGTVAELVGGIDFPTSKAQLLAHAEHNRSCVAHPEGLLRVLRDLPQRRYTNLADVEMEAGKICASLQD